MVSGIVCNMFAWSIPLALVGGMAIFVNGEWWAMPTWISCIILASIFSHINGSLLFRMFARKERAQITDT